MFIVQCSVYHKTRYIRGWILQLLSGQHEVNIIGGNFHIHLNRFESSHPIIFFRHCRNFWFRCPLMKSLIAFQCQSAKPSHVDNNDNKMVIHITKPKTGKTVLQNFNVWLRIKWKFVGNRWKQQWQLQKRWVVAGYAVVTCQPRLLVCMCRTSANVANYALLRCKIFCLKIWTNIMSVSAAIARVQDLSSSCLLAIQAPPAAIPSNSVTLWPQTKPQTPQYLISWFCVEVEMTKIYFFPMTPVVRHHHKYSSC